jgi:hypothetical protein
MGGIDFDKLANGQQSNQSNNNSSQIDFDKLAEQGIQSSQFDTSKIYQGDIQEFDSNFIPAGGFDALQKERAINQSTGEQFANSAIKLLPSIGLGILENAGYLMEIPDALFGDRKDFTNDLVEWSQKNRQSLEEEFPIYRENPNQTFDLTDNAWWFQNGSGLVESIGEFYATGLGVGSVLGKGASVASKALGNSMKAQSLAQGTAQLMTSASLAYTEGAMSGAQVYKEAYEDARNKGLSDKTANEIASKAAAKTVKLNTLVNTALNITSVAPLFNRNILKSARLNTKRLAGESIPAYKQRLRQIADDPLNGFRPNTKKVLASEILQEGLEEEVNLAAEAAGRKEAGLISEEEAGGDNFLSILSKQALTEEGALSFILGAVGGAGQTGVVQLATKNKRKAELDNIEKERLANITNIEETLSKIRNSQIELQAESSKENPDVQKINELKDELFDHNIVYHFNKGTEDALIGTMEEISSIDNNTDLGIEIAKQRDNTIEESNQIKEDLIQLEQAEQTPEVQQEITDKKNRLTELNSELEFLNKEFAEKSGKTEAMLQGLAEDQSDNRYKETAQAKISDIAKYKSLYRDLSFRYNTTEDRQLVDVASRILEREIAKEKHSKSFNEVSNQLTLNANDFNVDILRRTEDAFANDLLLEEARLEALKVAKQNPSLSKGNIEVINDQIKESETKIQNIKDNDQKLDGTSIEDKLKKFKGSDNPFSLYFDLQSKMINNENNIRDLQTEINNIKNDPDSQTRELKKFIKEQEKKAQKAKEQEVNQERKNTKDTYNKWSKLIDNAVSEQELDSIMDQIDSSDEIELTPNLIDKISKKRESLLQGSTTEVERDDLFDDIPSDIPEGGKDVTNDLFDELERDAQEEQDAEDVKDVTDSIFNELEGEESTTQVEEVESIQEVEDKESIPSSYTENSDFSSNPSFDNIIESEESEELQDVKIVEAAKSISYRVKSYRVQSGVKKTDSNDLDSNLNKGILVQDNYKEGDSVILKVETDFNKDIEGVNIKFEDFNNDPDTIPIQIIHKDTNEVLGYLHDINYINEDNVANPDNLPYNNIEFQKNTLKDIREKIVKEGGQVETTIDNIRSGFIISTNRIKNSEGNFMRNSSDVFQNPDLKFGIIGLTDNGVQSRGSDIKTRNSPEFVSFNEGKVVALLPDIKGELLAVPLSINKLTNEVSDTITNLIDLFLKTDLTDNDKKVIQDIKLETGENLRSHKGLSSLVEKYIMTTSLNNQRSEDIRDKGTDSRKKYINISKGRVSIQQQGRSRIDFTQPLTELDISTLKDHLNLMYYNINDDLMDSSNHLQPNLIKNEDGSYLYNQTKVDYNSFIKNNSRTNINENKFTYKGETHYSYFDNPVYEIDLNVKIADKIVENNEDIVENKPSDKISSKKPKNRRKLRSEKLSEKLNSDNSNVQRKESNRQSAIIQDENDESYSDLDELNKALTTKLNTAFTPEQLNDVVNTGVQLVLEDLIAGESVDSALDSWKEFIEDSIQDENVQDVERYENVLDNISEINEIIKNQVSNFRNELLIRSTNIDKSEGNEDLESVNEEVFKDSDNLWKTDNKFNSSERMKAFLMFTLEVDKVENKNGTIEYVPVPNYLGITNTIPIDKVFNKLKEVLSGVENDFDSMMEVLREEETNIPWLRSIRKNFTEENIEVIGLTDLDQFKNEFVKLMSNINYNFRTVLWSKDENGAITTKFVNSDTVSSFRRTLETWRNDVKNTPFYSILEGEYIFNEENAQKAIDWYDKNILERESFKGINLIELANNWLSLFGIETKDSVNSEILKRGKKGGSTKFTSNKGFYKIFYNRLKDSLNSESKSIIDTNPLLNNNSVIELAKLDNKHNDSINSTNFRNSKGNSINSINQTRSITLRLRKLKEKVSYSKNLLEIPFTKSNYSHLDNEIDQYETVLSKFSKGDSKALNGVRFSLLESLKQEGSSLNGTILSEMTPRQLEITKIGSFLDTKNFIEDESFFNYIHLVPGKSTTFLFRLPKERLILEDNLLHKSSLDKLYSVVLSEIDRMNSYDNAKKAEGSEFEEIRGFKPDMFYFFQGLNDLKDSEGNFIIQDGRVELTEEIKDLIKGHIQEEFKSLVEQKIDLWLDNNLLSQNEDGDLISNIKSSTFTDPYFFAADYIFNDMLGNFNMHQMFIGDPALFAKKGIDSTWGNIFKRSTKDQAPSTDYAKDSRFSSYLQVNLEDVIVDGINVADAQEFISVKENLINLLLSGTISENDYNQHLNTYDKTGKVPDIKGFFNPTKPVYAGKRVHKSKDNIPLAEVEEYVKSSAVSLDKSFTSGSQLDSIRKAIEDLEKDKELNPNGLPVRVSFESSNKLGGGKTLKVSDAEGNVLPNIKINKENFVIHERENLGNQQDLPYDSNKDKTIDGTQQKKLIQYSLENTNIDFDYNGEKISGKQLKDNYNKAYEKLFKDAALSLEEELLNENGELDLEKTSDFLIREAKKRNWDSNSIKGLQLKNGKFRIPLYFNTNTNKIESLLNSIISNNVIKNKRRGKSYVLVSEFGFKGYSKNIVYTEKYDPVNGLSENQIIVPTILKDESGNQIDVRNYAFRDSNGILKLDIEKIPEELLKGFGYRIPTVGYNYMTELEIVGFLPNNLGDRIIASKQLVRKMGSDFDVDKLYTFFPDYKLENGKYSKLDSNESTSNEILDLEIAIIENSKIREAVNQPDGIGGLQKAADNIKVDNLNPRISDHYRSNNYIESQDAAIGIGVFATMGTFLSSSVGKDLYHSQVNPEFPAKLDEVKVGFKEKDKSGNKISDYETIDGKSNKLRVNSYFLSASVDNEGNPVLGKLNLNKNTFNAVQALISGGFNESQIVKFINQDVIKRYNKRYSELLDNSVDEFSTDASLQAQIEIRNSLNLNEDSIFQEAQYSDINSENSYKQYEQLLKFIELTKLGKNINLVKNTINTDSKLLPKNILESINKENAVDDLKTNTSIANASKLLGEYSKAEDGIMRLDETDSISGHVSKYGLKLNNKLWKDIYSVYTQPFLTEANDLIANMSNSGKYLTDEQQLEVFRNAKTFMVGELFSSILKGGVGSETTRLLYGEDNIWNRISEAQKKYPNDIFLNNISVKQDSDPNAPVRIFFNNVSSQGIDNNFINRSFEQRLLDPDTNELIEDLIRYSVLTNFNNTAGSILNLVPIEYFEVKGISDVMYDISWNNPESVKNFIKQFIQNNPKYARRLDQSVQPDTIENTIILTGNKEYIIKNTYVPYVSYYSNDDKTYVLYSHDGNGVYRRISLLGYKGIREFDSTARNNDIQSHYTPNNVGVKSPNPSDKINENPNNKKYDNKDKPKAYFSKYNISNLNSLISSVRKNIKNESLSSIYTVLEEVTKDLNVKLKLVDSSNFEGLYNPSTKTIEMSTTQTEEVFQKTLVEETFHAILEDVINKPASERSKDQTELLNSLNGLKEKLNKSLQENTEKYSQFERKLRLFEEFNNDPRKDSYLSNPFTEEERDLYQSSVDLNEFVARIFKSEILQDYLNNNNFNDNKNFFERFIEVIKKFINNFNKTLSGDKIQKNSDLDLAINNVLGLTSTVSEKDTRDVTDDIFNELEGSQQTQLKEGEKDVTDDIFNELEGGLQSPVVKVNPDQESILILENSLGLRNTDGSRKRYLPKNFKKTLAKIVDLNRNKLDSNFRATRIKVKGEKGDSRIYDSIKIVGNNENKVRYSPIIKEDTEEDRITKVIDEFRKQENRLRSKLNTDAKGDKKEQANIRKEIDSLKEKIDLLANEKSIQNIIDFSKNQLNEIIETLDSDQITENQLHLTLRDLNLLIELDNLLLDESGFKDIESPIFKNIQEIKAQASSILTSNLIPKMKDYIMSRGETKNLKGNAENWFGAEPDINTLEEFGLGLQRTGLDVTLNKDKTVYSKSGYIVPLIDRLLVDADTLATQESNNRVDIIDEAFSKFEKSNFFKKAKSKYKNAYLAFAQFDSEGKKTGNLINRISDSYFKELEKLRNRKDFLSNSSDATTSQKNAARKKYIDFLNDNNIQVDVREIFNSETLELDESKVDSYVEKLAKELGGDFESSSRRSRDLVEVQVSRINSYKNYLEGETLRIESLEEDAATKERMLEEFKLKYSPFEYLNNKESKKTVSGRYVNSEGYKFLASTVIEKWQDKNFDEINNDEDAREFYKFMIGTFNDLYKIAPEDVFRELQYNHLPYYPKNLMEKINEDGIFTSSKSVGESLMKLFTEKGLDSIDTNDRDIKTGQIEYDILFPSKQVPKGDTKIEEQVSLENQSFDLKKIMKIYTMSVMSYKHKKSIEDDVWLARALFDYQVELETKGGVVQLDKDGDPITKKLAQSLKNKKGQLDYVIMRKLLGVNPDNLTIFESKKKILSSTDKKAVKELNNKREKVIEDYGNGKINHEDKEKIVNDIDSKIQSKGAKITGRSILKSILDLVRGKGMGLNVFASITNLNIAHLSNRIHAAGREDFTNKEVNQAMSVVLGSTTNLLPGAIGGAILGTIIAPGFGTIFGAGVGSIFTLPKNMSKGGKKLRNLMNKFEVLGDVTDSSLSENENKLFSAEWLYSLQKNSEYFSQGTTLVAMMKFKKIKNLKGEEVSLWDAYDENGNWKSDEFSKELNNEWTFEEFKEGEGTGFLGFKRKLNSTLSKIHGDYTKTTALKINSNVIGQSVSMFRRWIPEGINQRFGDYQGEDDFKTYRQGRYKIFLEKTDAIKKGLKLLVTFNKGEIDTTGWMDHEVANLRKNVAELQMYLGLLAVALVSKGLSDDDDDEYSYINNFVLNQIFRLQSDLTFYVSASSFENVTRNAVPAFALFNDVVKTAEYAERVLFDDDATSKTTQAFWLRTLKLFPAGSAGVSTYRATEQLFTDN